MNYIVDNTISDPGDASGYAVGSQYLVPSTGGEGAWFGKEDMLATWGGEVWTFSEPSEGTQLQVETGVNAGMILTRTSVVSRHTEFVPNSSLDQNTSGFPAWVISATGTAVANWNAGGFIHLESNGGDPAKATVTITTVAGVRYRLVFSPSNVVADGVTENCTATVRNVSDSLGLEDVNFTSSGNRILYFVATGTSTSIEFKAEGGNAAMDIGSASVKQVFNLVTSGDFEDSAAVLADWYIPAHWTNGYLTDGSLGMIATVTDPAHTTYPALAVLVSDLVAGVVYRVDFVIISTDKTKGVVSGFFDSKLVADAGTARRFTGYIKATGTSANFAFPITKVGSAAYTAELDNVSVGAAMWQAAPILKTVMAGKAGVTASPNISRAASAQKMECKAAMTSAATVERSGVVALAGRATITASAYRTYARSGTAVFATRASIKAKGSQDRVGAVTFAAKASMSVANVGLGLFTVKMAVDSILSLWSDLGGCQSGSGCRQIEIDALERLNAAMQKLHASGQDWGYVSNVAMTLTPGTGETEIKLPNDVQHVKRLVFLPALDSGGTAFAKFPLRPMKTRHELEAYRLAAPKGIWALSSAESTLSGSTLPVGYFTEAEDTRSGTGLGPPYLRIMLAPEYTGENPWKVEAQVAVAPPRYKCEDIKGGTRLHIPNRYAETLLMPLARYYALSSRNFTKPDLRESVVAQAAEVLTLLGDLQPAQPEAAKTTKETASASR